MSNSPADSSGVSFYFHDSGAVPNSTTYTTVVVYHGAAFTGDTFHKILPLASKHNLRVVIVNRRQYHGSTPYTAEELALLNEGKKEFLELIGVNVSNFLMWYLTEHNIPKMSDDGKSGGLALMGWSIGIATPFSFLGNPTAVTLESYAKLEPYLRKFFIYDSPHLAFGYPTPTEDVYNVWTDPAFPTPEDKFKHFPLWVSAYYNHDLPARKLSALDHSSQGQRPSFGSMSVGERGRNFDGAAAAQTEFPMFTDTMQPHVRVQANRALFDEEWVSTVLPKLEIAHMTCTRTNWHCAYQTIETEKIYNGYVKLGHKVRPMKFYMMEGANHFIHWDEPQAFITKTASIIYD